MNQLAQEAVLIGLLNRLAANGSWGGETHLQKASYLASELCDIDFDFDFILYKHGPFSFELRDEINQMQDEGLIRRVVPNPRYGPQIRSTDAGAELEEHFSKTMDRYGKSLDWIAETVGSKGVMALECLATAMWVTRENEEAGVKARADMLIEVKPHISSERAVLAVEEIDTLIAA